MLELKSSSTGSTFNQSDFQTYKVSNELSVCLHVLCQNTYTKTSITSPSAHPKTDPTSSKFRLPTFSFHVIPPQKMQEMIICISANLSSQTLADKMNAVKP